MRKLIFGLLGLATLGFGALSAPQAQAQPYYGGPGYHRAPAVEYRAGPVVVRHEYGRPHRRVYRPAPVYRPARAVRRCWAEPRRVWNGYRYVHRSVQVCRTVRGPGYRW
jgi:hypothetical protein